MSLIWMDGFGQYKEPAELAVPYTLQGDGALLGTNIACLPTGGPATTASGNTRPASGALQFLGNVAFAEDAQVGIDIPSGKTEIIVGFNFMCEGFNDASNYTYDNFIEISDTDGALCCQLEFEDNYAFDDYPTLAGWFNINGLTSNERWSGRDESGYDFPDTYGFQLDTFYYIELRVLLGNGDGEIELRVNGEVWANLTSQDTQPGSPTTFGGMKFKTSDTYASSQYGGGLKYRIADWWLIETGTAPNQDFLYPAVIDALLPTADTTEADFTPSAGSDNFAGVDDASGHNYDTDYNDSNTAGHKDRFTSSGSLPESPKGDVMGVMAVAMVRDDADLGTRTARTVVFEGATEAVGATVTLTESGYQAVSDIFEVNPDTAAAWTIAEVEAAEFGIELVT